MGLALATNIALITRRMAKQKTAQTSKLARRADPLADTSLTDPASMRLDKWLWCARFYKTRGLAVDEIGRGRVLVNAMHVKASREIRPGDVLAIGLGPTQRTVTVLALSSMRGPASVAQQLYAETADSLAARERHAELRRLAPEPADMLRHGRPTKKDRRDMDELTQPWPGGREPPALDQRWSARIDSHE